MLMQLDGGRVYYDLVGDAGKPLVCLAHSLCADGGMWAEQIPTLICGGFRALRVDIRGHGGSDAFPGDYTMSMLANDVLAVLDQVEATQDIHFIGLSIGGMIGQTLAIEHPTRVKSY